MRLSLNTLPKPVLVSLLALLAACLGLGLVVYTDSSAIASKLGISADPVERIRIASSSAGSPPIKLLAREFSKRNPNVRFEFSPELKTATCLQYLKDGKADIAVFARDLKPEEKEPLLSAHVLAYDPIAVVINASLPVEGFSTGQLKAVYAGDIDDWHELGGAKARILLGDRSEDETAKIAMRAHAFGGDLQISPRAVIFETESEMVRVVSETPYSMGYASSTKAKGVKDVRIVSVDGYAPSVENVATNRYKIKRPVGVATHRPNDTIVQFIEFARSDEAREVLTGNGYVPASLVK